VETQTTTTEAATTETAKVELYADSDTGGDKGAEGAEAKAEGEAAPEVITYTDFTLPEGIDATLTEGYKAFGQQHKLTQDAVQALIDRDMQLQSDTTAEIERQNQAWLEEAQKDKDIGGAKFKETQVAINNVIGKFASEDAVKALTESGLHNNVHVMKFLHAISKEFTEVSGEMGVGKSHGATEKSVAQRWGWEKK
jgi:hypothetical protein